MGVTTDDAYLPPTAALRLRRLVWLMDQSSLVDIFLIFLEQPFAKLLLPLVDDVMNAEVADPNDVKSELYEGIRELGRVPQKMLKLQANCAQELEVVLGPQKCSLLPLVKLEVMLVLKDSILVLVFHTD